MLRLVAVGLLVFTTAARAGTVYEVHRAVGLGYISGTIETNGTIGPLAKTDILSWSFESFDGTDRITTSSASGAGLLGDAWKYLSATESELVFDFDGAFADSDANLIGFNGGDGSVPFSFDYNLVGSDLLGRVEQLVHQFGTDGEHISQAPRQGAVVIGRVPCPTELCPPDSIVLKLLPLLEKSRVE